MHTYFYFKTDCIRNFQSHKNGARGVAAVVAAAAAPSKVIVRNKNANDKGVPCKPYLAPPPPVGPPHYKLISSNNETVPRQYRCIDTVVVVGDFFFEKIIIFWGRRTASTHHSCTMWMSDRSEPNYKDKRHAHHPWEVGVWIWRLMGAIAARGTLHVRAIGKMSRLILPTDGRSVQELLLILWYWYCVEMFSIIIFTSNGPRMKLQRYR